MNLLAYGSVIAIRMHLRRHGLTADDLQAASWYKSSASSYNGNCVEVAHLRDGRVAVRDTKDHSFWGKDAPVTVLQPEQWAGFLADVKDGKFDSL
jgi:Domain of unknown function (DUF397)